MSYTYKYIRVVGVRCVISLRGVDFIWVRIYMWVGEYEFNPAYYMIIINYIIMITPSQTRRTVLAALSIPRRIRPSHLKGSGDSLS